MVRLCSCGFATDDDDWLAGHLTEHPEHREMDPYWTLEALRSQRTAGTILSRWTWTARLTRSASRGRTSTITSGMTRGPAGVPTIRTRPKMRTSSRRPPMS
jgi:hypothetical protein